MAGAIPGQGQVTVLAPGPASLGEGPTWDAGTRTLQWVDIDHGQLWSIPWSDGQPGEPALVLETGPTLGAAARAADGGLLLARTRHLEHRAADGRVLGRLRLIAETAASRLNDGACDPDGRYLVGSLSLDGRDEGQRLWRLEPDGSLTVLDDDLSLSNGIGWSPDGRTMYVVDTLRHRVYARSYDRVSGAVGPREVFVETPGDFPDGLCVDADGDLWVAFWGAGEVRRFGPDGLVRGSVATGAPLTTSCAFAGDELDVLVVSSAGKAVEGVPGTDRSGALLALRPGARGRPEPRWQPVPMPAGDGADESATRGMLR